jgi:hypothetical protein
LESKSLVTFILNEAKFKFENHKCRFKDRIIFNVQYGTVPLTNFIRQLHTFLCLLKTDYSACDILVNLNYSAFDIMFKLQDSELEMKPKHHIRFQAKRKQSETLFPLPQMITLPLTSVKFPLTSANFRQIPITEYK